MNKPITLVFTDIVGSSAAKRAGTLGADASARDRAYLEGIQTKHLRLVRGAVAEHNGAEIMTMGDGFFLTFAEPVDALRCAAAIQQRLNAHPIDTPSGPLQLRIGIHVGTPEYFENSWHGTDVDIASRTESAGSPDQILVTGAARKAMDDPLGIKFRPLGTFALKGVGDVKLWDADYDQHGLRRPSLLSNEQKRRNRRLSVAVLVLVIAGATALGYSYYKRHQVPRITDKDQIIVADFDNKTGDPVFDSTLKEALDIQLQQSPYLQLVNDQELQSDLRYLRQPADQKITPTLAREIGQREGIKAYLAGSVASLGNSYVVSIDAVNCATGETFARQQVEAPDKPHVLTAVATAVTGLRATLGESLASIHKLSSPYMDVTTSSLEAFHDFSLGEDEHRKGHDLPEAESFYRQAIELDPTFAMAYARLGVVYGNSGSVTQGIAYLAKAYDLRQRVTERERLYIEAQLATQEQNLSRGLELYQLDITTYPRDSVGWNNMGVIYSEMGDLEKAINAYERSYQLAKWDVVGAANSAQMLLATDRLPEAKHYIEETRIEGGMEDTNSISVLMLYRFQSGDPTWRQLIPTVADHQDAFVLDELAANADVFSGHLKDARIDEERGAQVAASAKLSDSEATILATMAMNDVQLDDCPSAKALAHRALALDRSIASLPNSALALALCGEAPTALAETVKLAKANPDSTLVKNEYLPEVRAAAALSQHQPQQVKDLLTNSETYAVASYIPYLEGRAFLEMKQPADSITALEPARRWRGAGLQAGDSASGPIQFTCYPAALLLTAKAQTMAGDKQAASSTFQQLLDIWKTADADFKPREEAQHELADLQKNGKTP